MFTSELAEEIAPYCTEAITISLSTGNTFHIWNGLTFIAYLSISYFQFPDERSLQGPRVLSLKEDPTDIIEEVTPVVNTTVSACCISLSTQEIRIVQGKEHALPDKKTPSDNAVAFHFHESHPEYPLSSELLRIISRPRFR